jgi:hypothetical protein
LLRVSEKEYAILTGREITILGVSGPSMRLVSMCGLRLKCGTEESHI